jgi:hypothetical protein
MYYHDVENGWVYINYDRIWSVLEEEFSISKIAFNCWERPII